ncbi:MAG: hypothetical protein ACJ05G_11270 [Actinomycetota bacterium]
MDGVLRNSKPYSIHPTAQNPSGSGTGYRATTSRISALASLLGETNENGPGMMPL